MQLKFRTRMLATPFIDIGIAEVKENKRERQRDILWWSPVLSYLTSTCTKSTYRGLGSLPHHHSSRSGGPRTLSTRQWPPHPYQLPLARHRGYPKRNIRECVTASKRSSNDVYSALSESSHRIWTTASCGYGRDHGRLRCVETDILRPHQGATRPPVAPWNSDQPSTFCSMESEPRTAVGAKGLMVAAGL